VGTLGFTNVFNEYLDVLPWDERYEFNPPGLTFHGLIVGTPYIDINSTALLRNISKPDDSYAEVKYHGRGWSGFNSYFRVEGTVFIDKKPVIIFKGKWNDSVSMTDLRTNVTEVVWKKYPYPANWDKQYGMTQHSLQLNYLPSWLRGKLPPTDSRLRPDQRALEHGDFSKASDEKNRLEVKQRAERKYMETNKVEHIPKYFEVWPYPPSKHNP
jgi:hypothetical protein